MKRRLIFLVLLAASIVPASAHAQRYRYRGGPTAMTPFGPVYNPALSPEYRLWVSNPAAYEQLMMQRQQQQMQREQQAFAKWLKDQKAKKAKGQPTDPAYDQMVRAQEASEAQRKAAASAPRGRSTHGRATHASTKRKGAAKAKAAATKDDTPATDTSSKTP